MNTRDELKINIYLYSQIKTTNKNMQPFVKQTINKKSVFKTWSVALLAATLGFGSYTTAAAKTDNSTTAKVIENYFGEHLAGKDAKLNCNDKGKTADVASSRTSCPR